MRREELIMRLRHPQWILAPKRLDEGATIADMTEAATALESSEAETERLKQSNNEAQSEIDDLTEDLERAEAESSRLRERVLELETEVRIVASVPIPESAEKNSLGWLKARARSLLDKTEGKS
jgi:chromosome segregation ATPase